MANFNDLFQVDPQVGYAPIQLLGLEMLRAGQAGSQPFDPTRAVAMYAQLKQNAESNATRKAQNAALQAYRNQTLSIEEKRLQNAQRNTDISQQRANSYGAYIGNQGQPSKPKPVTQKDRASLIMKRLNDLQMQNLMSDNPMTDSQMMDKATKDVESLLSQAQKPSSGGNQAPTAPPDATHTMADAYKNALAGQDYVSGNQRAPAKDILANPSLKNAYDQVYGQPAQQGAAPAPAAPAPAAPAPASSPVGPPVAAPSAAQATGAVTPLPYAPANPYGAPWQNPVWQTPQR
jgi:hypothetical protein